LAVLLLLVYWYDKFDLRDTIFINLKRPKRQNFNKVKGQFSWRQILSSRWGPSFYQTPLIYQGVFFYAIFSPTPSPTLFRCLNGCIHSPIPRELL